MNHYETETQSKKKEKPVHVFLMTMLVSGMVALSLILLANKFIDQRERRSRTDFAANLAYIYGLYF